MSDTLISLEVSEVALAVEVPGVFFGLVTPESPTIEVENCRHLVAVQVQNVNLDVTQETISLDLVALSTTLAVEGQSPANLSIETTTVEIIERCEQGPPGPPGGSVQRHVTVAPSAVKSVDSAAGLGALAIKWLVHLNQGGKTQYMEVACKDGSDFSVSSFFGDTIQMSFNVIGFELFFENQSQTYSLNVDLTRMTIQGV